jgi:hypothetical protein
VAVTSQRPTSAALSAQVVVVDEADLQAHLGTGPACHVDLR